MPAVEFRDVGYQIEGREILRNISVTVESGETLALLGRSGSGKTTMLRLVNALLYPTSGEVLVEGRPTWSWDVIELRRHIGYVIQEVGLFPHWNVERNVGLVPRLLGQPDELVHGRVDNLLSRVGVPAAEYGKRRPRELSGGQRQRVGVARALAGDPPILLFDEPFGALDPITRLELQHLFVSLRRDFAKTALFVTHDVREALLVGTRIGLFDNGRLAWIGAASEFRGASIPEAAAFLAGLTEEHEPGARP